ncbi:spore coat U domain-containing protein [Mesorhizobium sp. M7A.F.Ca.CA.001.09.2.1]|uniref:Spore coat U domain-containing protein n=3 Tax=Mesorhizobium TaxID=68287 RepID=A0AB38TKZ0_9HYPH|nr:MULTISPECIES: spore coat U domain-containing protein [Mesorhizobium]AMY04315.1 spore coat protein U [Mesorhizobium ciceri biovar biserrulae]MDF3218507.1 spore coat U domain-containing protein [Mesorhizobium ciceri]RUY64260.1 spore coat U domain-containing protein [Mesorhizobium sp. M7A.F.Ca.CA.001.13.1.1]RUY68951.1 spore coat U domain-containing protein [Mesorhizobium sp. M7A.F.Ca.CA.001.05.1.1]RUY69810.1 spore coat U domain-containing protein [Mesorhizobium sp. M7A.F.Ca.CA.001.09.2.1]
MRACLAAFLALISAASLTDPALAAVATGNMTVRITITAECKVQTASDLDFGSKGVIDANADQTSTIGVQCTSGQTYNVGLSAGAGAGATVAVRKMTGPGAATVNYMLYRDTGRTQPWGITVGTDTVAGTGNGNVQNLTVYGRVPPQTTPAAGVYTDTVAITVTY